MSIFKDKVLLITGGTGSFGNAVLRRFLDSDIKEIRIFSRDEKKQDDMRHRLQNPKVKFYIGNVRNKQSVDVAMRGVDYVFSAAALKQVPSCEFFPIEAVKTNVLGTENVLTAAIDAGVDAYINTAINGLGERAGNADLVSCLLAVTKSACSISLITFLLNSSIALVTWAW